MGKISIEVSILSRYQENIYVIVSKNKINSKNKFQYFKTTNRNYIIGNIKSIVQKDFLM